MFSRTEHSTQSYPSIAWPHHKNSNIHVFSFSTLNLFHLSIVHFKHGFVTTWTNLHQCTEEITVVYCWLYYPEKLPFLEPKSEIQWMDNLPRKVLCVNHIKVARKTNFTFFQMLGKFPGSSFPFIAWVCDRGYLGNILHVLKHGAKPARTIPPRNKQRYICCVLSMTFLRNEPRFSFIFPSLYKTVSFWSTRSHEKKSWSQ